MASIFLRATDALRFEGTGVPRSEMRMKKEAMKRTRIVTAIHYRRSLKKSVSRKLPTHCPVCGAALVTSEAGQMQADAKGLLQSAGPVTFSCARCDVKRS